MLLVDPDILLPNHAEIDQEGHKSCQGVGVLDQLVPVLDADCARAVEHCQKQGDRGDDPHSVFTKFDDVSCFLVCQL